MVLSLAFGSCSGHGRRLRGAFSTCVAFAILASSSVALGQTAQTITFAAISGKTYGNTPFVVSATASSGLSVSFSSQTASVCTVSATTVTLVAAGSCTVRASQAGNATYAPAPNIDRTFAVAKAAQTITFGTLSGKTFGNAPFSVAATTTSGLAVTFSSTTTSICTVSGSTVTLVAAGSCTIRASQAGNTNYNAAANVDRSFTIAKASQTITFPQPANIQYAPTAVSLTVSATSGLQVALTSLTTAYCTVSGLTVSLVKSGPCQVRAAQAGNSNFLAASNVTRTFTILKADQTVSFPQISAKLLTTPPFVVSATASSGLAVAVDTNNGPVCVTDGWGLTVTLLAAGNCALQANQYGDERYNPAPTAYMSFAVVADQTITFSPIADQAIGSGPVTLQATSSSGLPVGFQALTPSTCSVSSASVTLLALGVCTVQATQPGDGTIPAAPPVSRSFTILQTQSITFAALPSIRVSAGPVALSAVATSNLPVSFSSLTQSVCTVAGTITTLVAQGACKIRASQSGNSSFAAAPHVERTFEVLPPPTVTYTYDAAGRVIGIQRF